jgi:hypothetical protein
VATAFQEHMEWPCLALKFVETEDMAIEGWEKV